MDSEGSWARGTTASAASTRVARERGQATRARPSRCIVRGRWGSRRVFIVTRAGVPRKGREVRVIVSADGPVGDAKGNRDGTGDEGSDGMVQAGPAHQEPEARGLEQPAGHQGIEGRVRAEGEHGSSAVRRGNASQVAEATRERRGTRGADDAGGDGGGGSDQGGASRALAQDNRPEEFVVRDGNWVVERGAKGGAACAAHRRLEGGQWHIVAPEEDSFNEAHGSGLRETVGKHRVSGVEHSKNCGGSVSYV